MFIRVLAPLTCLLLLTVPGASLATAAATSTMSVPASQPWTDTGIAVKTDVTVMRQQDSDESRDAGIRFEISSTTGWQPTRFRVENNVPFTIQFISGSWTVDTRNFPSVGPQGYQRQTDREIFQGCKVDNRQPYAALLARVGDSGPAFAVRRGGQFRSPDDGRLFLRINDADRCLGDNKGSIVVNLRRTQGQSLRPPRITRVETYREGGLVYLRAFFTDPNGDAKGFGFRGANGSGWAEESHPFSNPSYGRVGPGRVDYPFNLGCGTGRDYETDIEFWIYDASGLRSESKIHHLTCGT